LHINTDAKLSTHPKYIKARYKVDINGAALLSTQVICHTCDR